MPLRRHLPVVDMEQIIRKLLARQTQRHMGCSSSLSLMCSVLCGTGIWTQALLLIKKNRTMTIVIFPILLNVGLNLLKRRIPFSGIHLKLESVNKLLERFHAANICARSPAVS